MTTSRRKRLLALTGTLLLVLPISAIAANWQWNRHLAREARNLQIAQADASEAIAYPGPLQDGYDDADRFRRLVVSGTWIPSEQLFVRKQVVNGSVGFGVVTPFMSDTGDVLFVQRGWSAEPNADQPESTVVTITVRVQAVQPSGPMRPSDLPPGQVNWIDPTELAAGKPHADAVFDLIDPTDGTLVAIPAPEQSSGPHVGYTIHWILIGIAAVIIYVRLVRSEIYGVDEN